MKRSAKIRFVVPSCVYTSNWAHEVMIMQEVCLCIVEVQEWFVCKVIDTSCLIRDGFTFSHPSHVKTTSHIEYDQVIQVCALLSEIHCKKGRMIN